MYKSFSIPALLLFLAACTSGEDTDLTNKNCYELRDTTTFGELGSWYQVAMAYDKVNKLGCFDIDTTGQSRKLMPDLSFTIGGNQHRGAAKCTYDISDDYRKLYNFDFHGDTTSDTITYEIGHLDRDYLVLILQADTAAWKDARTLSVLYMRKHF